jgi:hypothetical protein
MNKFAVWKDKAGEYTVLKNNRVYIMSENPTAKDGYDEHICSEGDIDLNWMDKFRQRVEFKDLTAELKEAIERRY